MIDKQMISESLSKWGVDGLFVQKDENLRYISGFTVSDSYLFVTPEAFYLLTDSRYVEQAKEEAEGFTVVDYRGKLAETLARLSSSHYVKRLGIESVLSYRMYLSFDETMPDVDFEFCPVDDVRRIKSDEELSLLKRACEISDEGFKNTSPYIRAGVTERYLQAVLECEMLKAGSEGKSFDTIVASGYGGVYPKGMVIGTVEQVDVDSIGGTQVARIVPAADFSHLEEVFIITDHIQRATPESILVKPPKKEPPMNPNKHQAGEKE